MEFLNKNENMTSLDNAHGTVCPPTNTLSLKEISFDYTVFRTVNKYFKTQSLEFNPYWDEDNGFNVIDNDLMEMQRIDEMLKDKNEVRPPIFLRKQGNFFVYDNGRHRHARLLILSKMNPDTKIYEGKDYVIEKNPGPSILMASNSLEQLFKKDNRYAHKKQNTIEKYYYKVKNINQVEFKIQRIPENDYKNWNYYDEKNEKLHKKQIKIENFEINVIGEYKVGRETLNELIKFRTWECKTYTKKLMAQVFDNERKEISNFVNKADLLVDKMSSASDQITEGLVQTISKSNVMLDTGVRALDEFNNTIKMSKTLVENSNKTVESVNILAGKSNNFLDGLEKIVEDVKGISASVKFQFENSFSTIDLIIDLVGIIDSFVGMAGSSTIMVCIRLMGIVAKVVKYLIKYFPTLKQKMNEILDAFNHAKSMIAQSGSLEQMAISAFLVAFLPQKFLKIFKDIPIMTSFKLLDDTTWCYDLLGWILDLPVVLLRFVGAPAFLIQYMQKLSTIFPFTRTSFMKREMRYWINRYTKDNRIIGQKEFRTELANFKKKVDDWLVDIHEIRDGLPQGLKDTILTFQSLTKKSVDYDQTTRKEPIFFCFDGPPGCGKSTLMRDLIRVLETYHTIYTHSSPSEGKDFYDLYNGEDIFVMDDIGQKGNAQWGNIINMVSTIKFPLDAAEVSAKGTKFFTSDLLLGTTNNIHLNLVQSDPIKEVGAVYRRIDRLNMAYIKFEEGSYSGYLTYELYDIKDKVWKQKDKFDIDVRIDVGTEEHGSLLKWLFEKIKNRISFKKKIFSQAPSKFDFGALDAEVGVSYNKIDDNINIETDDNEIFYDVETETVKINHKRDNTLDIVKEIKEFMSNIPMYAKELSNWLKKKTTEFITSVKDIKDDVTEAYNRNLLIEVLKRMMPEIVVQSLMLTSVVVIWQIFKKLYIKNVFIIKAQGCEPFTVRSMEDERIKQIRKMGIYYKVLNWKGKEIEDEFYYVETPNATYGVNSKDLDSVKRSFKNVTHKIVPSRGQENSDFMVKNTRKKRTLAQLVAQSGSIQALFTYFAERVGGNENNRQITEYWTGICKKHVRLMTLDVNMNGKDYNMNAVVFVSGLYVLGPSHMVDNVNRDFDMFATIYRDYNTILYDKQRLNILDVNEKEDWVLFQFSEKYLPNLHPKFAGFSSKKNLEGCDSYQILTPLGPIELGNKVKTTDFKTTYISLAGKERAIDDKDIIYDQYQGYGLCGSLIVASEGILLGMHVTGIPEEETGIAKVFSRSSVIEINKILEKGQEMDFELKREQGSEMKSRVLLDMKSKSNMNNTSRYVPSPLYGKVFEVTRSPAIFNGLGTVSETAKILSAAAYQPVQSVHSMALKFASGYVSTLLPGFVKLSEYEVIKGNEKLNPINKESSCGYLFSGFDKNDILNYENGTIRDTEGGNKLKERLKEIWSNVNKGKFDYNIWYKECFKDELRNENKVLKPRLFKASPIDLTYLTREYLGDLIGKLMMKTSRRKTGIMIGTNPFSADWKDLFIDLTEKSDYIVAGDWAKWDKAMLTQFQIVLADKIKEKFRNQEKKDINMLDYLLTTMYCSPTVTADEMYLTTHSMPSGHGMTAVYNSLINKMYGAYIFYKLHIKHEGFEPTVELYSKTVYDAVYGDDKLTASTYEWLNGLEIQKEALLLGLDFTPADKGEWKDGKCHIFSEQCTFLKRKFYLHDSLGMVAPLELGVLQATLNFITDRYRYDELTTDKLKNYQRELYLHGRAVYFRELDYLLEKLDEVGFKHLPLEESYLLKIYHKGLYVTEQRDLYAESQSNYVLSAMSKARDELWGGLETLEQPSRNRTKQRVLISETGLLNNECATENKNTTVDTMSGFGIKIMTREPTSTSQRENQFSVKNYESTILEPSWTLANMLERPAFFGTIPWSTTDASHTILATYRLPFQFLQNQITRVPFETFQYFRGDIELNIQVIATPLHQGMVKAVWVPLTDLKLINDHIVKNFRALSMCQSVDLFPNTNTTAKMNISFTFQKEYMNTNNIGSANISDSLGYLVIVVFNPLQAAANSSSSVTISTFGQIKNAEFKVPKRPLQAQSLGFLAGPLTSIIKSILPKRVVNDPIGEAVNFATNILDKPNNVHIETPSSLESVGELNNVRGIEYARKMVLEPSEVAITRGDTFGTKHDEMTFDDLKKRYTYMGSFSVSINDTIGTNIASFPIRPITYTKFNYDEPVVPTLLEYITLPFAYWNGSLNVKIQAIATSLQTCKIFMAVHYGENALVTSTLNQATSQYGVAFEINQGSNEFEFNIPFVSEFHQLYVSGSNVVSRDNATGMVAFYLMNNLVCPNNTPTTIFFNTYIAGGDDYQVNTLSPTGVCNKKFEVLPDVLKAQSAAQPLITDDVDVQATTKQAEILSPTEDNKTNDVIGSESHMMSIQSLLKKYQLVRFITRKAGGDAIYSTIPIQSLAFDTVAQMSGQGGLLQHFAALYRLWKGPLRIKIVVESSETTTPVDVFFIPPGNYPATPNNFSVMTNQVLFGNRLASTTPLWITEVRTTGIQKTMTLEIPFTTIYKSLSLHKGPLVDFGDETIFQDKENLGFLCLVFPEAPNTKGTSTCSIYAAFGDETRFGVPMTIPFIQFSQVGGSTTYPTDYSSSKPEFSLTVL